MASNILPLAGLNQEVFNIIHRAPELKNSTPASMQYVFSVASK
jgi:hypothetical protein